jgi:hypothetical protein
METVMIMIVTDGPTDGEPGGTRHTIIHPVFNGRIKSNNAASTLIKETKCIERYLISINKRPRGHIAHLSQ